MVPLKEVKGSSAATTLTEIAAHLALSRTAVRDLKTQGIISQSAGLDACRIMYLRHLRARRQTDVDDRLRLARAKAIEQRTLREANELVRTEECLAVIDHVIGRLVVYLGAVPARCTTDPGMRKIIEREIDAVRSKAAADFERQSAALQTTGKAAASQRL